MKKTMMLGALFCLILMAATVAATTLDIRVSETSSLTKAFDGTVYSDSGTSHTGVSLSALSTSNGQINVTNVASETLSGLNITFNGFTSAPVIDTVPSYLASPVGYNFSTYAPSSPLYLYLRQLQAGDSVIFNYTSGSSGSSAPINITESYSGTKVLAGNSFDVTINAKNLYTGSASGVKLVKTPPAYITIGGTNTYLNYTAISGADAGNAAIAGTGTAGDPTILTWNVNGGSVATLAEYTIVLTVHVPDNLNGTGLGDGTQSWGNVDWGAWANLGTSDVTFTAAGSDASDSGTGGVNVSGVIGTGVGSIEAGKERINTTHWKESVNVKNPSTSLTYNLSSVRVWAMKQGTGEDPGVLANIVAGSDFTYTPFISFGPGDTYNRDQNFSYSDVPIIYGTADFSILDNDSTVCIPGVSGCNGEIRRIVQTTSKVNGYLVIEEIYILNGYSIKVTKHVDPSVVFDNVYNVSIVIENVGNLKTPDLVTVFDMIPPNFDVVGDTDGSITITNENELSMTNSSGVTITPADNSDQFRGEAEADISGGGYDGYHYFKIDMTALLSGSAGNGVYDTGSATSEVEIAYKLNGTGTFADIQNAFVVGVDPIRLDGANPSKSVITGMAVEGRSTMPVEGGFAAAFIIFAALTAFSVVFRKD